MSDNTSLMAEEAQALSEKILDLIEGATDFAVAMTALVAVAATTCGAFNVPVPMFAKRMEVMLANRAARTARSKS